MKLNNNNRFAVIITTFGCMFPIYSLFSSVYNLEWSVYNLEWITSSGGSSFTLLLFWVVVILPIVVHVNVREFVNIDRCALLYERASSIMLAMTDESLK